ncbi:MAG: enoyl-CoA hydratase [Bacteriovoracaceae bacterium]|nr:enoyl-CoA hydratase [Bacteriovoracaceae bacterium]
MNFNNIKFEEKDSIGFISLNRPEKLNALSVELFSELKEVLLSLNFNNSKVKGLILFGEGERAFAAGADIKQMSTMSQIKAHQFSALAQEVTLLLENLPIPTISCVDGFALGGGCELAMACDFIYATEKSSFGQPEVSLGLIPGFGGCIRFVRALGVNKAKEFIFSGKQIPAAQAKKLNLVNKVLPNRIDLFNEATDTLHATFKNSPAAIALTKKVINSTLHMPIEEALKIERDAFAAGFSHPEKTEGVTAFLEKRKAKY